jgi:hypothetical protein
METLTGRRYGVLTSGGESVTEVCGRAAYERIARQLLGNDVQDLCAIWARVSTAPPAGFLTPLDEAA